MEFHGIFGTILWNSSEFQKVMTYQYLPLSTFFEEDLEKTQKSSVTCITLAIFARTQNLVVFLEYYYIIVRA
jgi:hypothetical protein